MNGFVVHMFGDRTQIHARCNPDRRHHDFLVDRVIRQVADERAVDLHVIERETLEVLEGGQTGTEIVQCDAESLALEVIEQTRRGRRIADGFAFGDLEHNAFSRNAAQGALLADVVGDGAIAHRGA